MLSKEMQELGSKRSVIRDIFEYGNKRAREYGPDSVFDFSLGNPSVPAPKEVNDAIEDIIKTLPSIQVHGYTSAPGAPEVREAIADNLNRRFDTHYTKESLYLTSGAAMALTSICRALTLDKKTEFIAFAPCFPEYNIFSVVGGAKLRVVEADIPSFQINFDAFERLLNPNTQGVIVNSPNNPTGVVYSKDIIIKLAEILTEKSKKFGHPIYLISDEPYRELVYDGTEVPYIPRYYDNTIICYSYSKSLSLPGERIGYVLMPDSLSDCESIRYAVAGAARSLGNVCAPSLMQRVVARCMEKGVLPDVKSYLENRDLLCSGLKELGYKFVKPKGAFYLFMEALGGDDEAFCEFGKKYGVLMVPGTGFHCPGWVRISYCVDSAMIKRSLPAFAKIIKQYK